MDANGRGAGSTERWPPRRPVGGGQHDAACGADGAFNETPTLTKGSVMQVRATVSLQARPTRY